MHACMTFPKKITMAGNGTWAGYLKETGKAGGAMKACARQRRTRRCCLRLTAFHPFARATDARNPHKSETFVQRMKEEYGFILTKTPTPDGRWPIRISTPLWITPGHIDQLVDAMQDLAKKMN